MIEKNRKILAKRHGTNISKAIEIEGWMDPIELRWLSQEARKCKTIIEVGSWYGRSTRAFADNIQEDGVIYAVDHWLGEGDWLVQHSQDEKFDEAYYRFCKNMWDCDTTIVPIRMHSAKAAKFLKEIGVQADMIFIDGGHEYKVVHDDILNFKPLLRPMGLMSGHDYMSQGTGVTQAVHDAFGGNVAHLDGTSIWYSNAPLQEVKPRIYDCFIFFRELELLDIRFNELIDTVDRFVIVEGTRTHQGDPKPLYFELNLDRYRPFLHKVTYIVDDFSDLGSSGNKNDDTWARIRHQDESIMRGLGDCRSDDIIMISDVDEIPRASAVKRYTPDKGLCYFEQKLYYYFLNCLNSQKWTQAKILPFYLLKDMGVCNARYAKESTGKNGEMIPFGGWHFSYQGGVERIIQKLKSFSHSEYNRWEYLVPERIQAAMDQGKDLLGRPDQRFDFVPMDESYPRYVLQNWQKFQEMGWIK